MVAVCIPSTSASSTAVTVNVTNACPAGMITSVGMSISEASPLTRVTVSGSVVTEFLLTVAIAVPPSSLMEVGETETVSAAGPSLSVTTISPVAAAYPAPAAVIVTVWSPSATASSTAPIANGAEVNSPAIMVIVVLTVASLMSLLDSVTTSGLATSVLLRLTVAVVAPPGSPIDAARMTRDSAS